MLFKKHKILIIIVVFVIALISLNKFGGKTVRNTFYKVSSPLTSFFWKTGETVSDFLRGFFRAKVLKQENELLYQQNLRCRSELTDLKILREENQKLRKALNLQLEKEFQLALTEIIAKETGNDFILISSGKKDGISEGMPVISEEKVLVGRVEKSLPDFSQVRLISSNKFIFDVAFQHLEQTGQGESPLGVAEGKGDLKIALDLVPKESQISEGDMVITTALGGKFPQGLLVGEVKEVQKSAAEPFQKGEITPYFTRTNLTTLLVITDFQGYREEN